MNQEQKARYQRLQRFIYALQQEVWTIKEIDKKTAFIEVVSFAQNILGIKIAPKDPEFLPTVEAKITELLSAPPEQPAPNIPPNLQELVRIYEDRLQESQAQTQKFIFPTLDEQIKALYRRYAEKIHQQLTASEEHLAQNPQLAKEISLSIANQIVMTLPQVAREGAFSEKEYQEILVKIQPIITQELKRAGIEKPKAKIETRETFEEAKSLAATPHAQIAPKPPVAPVKIPQAPQPKISDLPYLFKQPSGVKVGFGVRTQAAIKKVALTPIAKPLQWLIHLAPEEFRASHPGLVYAATGFTDVVAQQAFEQTWKTKPKSPEVGFWHNLTTVFKEEKPPFLGVFRNYYQWDWLGRVGTKVETFTPSRFFTFRSSFWRIFKSSRIGGLFSRGAKKIFVSLGKLASMASKVIAQVPVAWGIFKRAMKVAGAYLLGLLMIAAHYGPAAVTGSLLGALGGGVTGGIIGYKIGGLIGAAIGGPLGMIIGGTIGFILGIFAQFIWDKITAVIGGISLPQIGSLGLHQATAATVSTAGWAVPTAVATAVAGGIIISQVVSGAFFIPTEKRPSPWAEQSEYIQVEKSVAFKGEVNPTRTIDNGEINDSTVFTYQFTVAATTATLTNIRAEDIITITQETGTNQIATKVWTNIPNLSAGETWTSEPYDIPTRPVDKFTDSILSNLITVTADVEEQGLTGEQSFASTTVIIGNPPQDCPRSWPVDTDPIKITQGPWGTFSPHQEAIDIGDVGNTTPVKATHAGVVYTGDDPGKGKYVSITSTCNGVTFNSLYAHLKTILIEDNKPVNYGETIGITDDTGVSTGPHLHYEFRSPNYAIKMARPNIPADIPRGDVCTEENPCFYSQ